LYFDLFNYGLIEEMRKSLTKTKVVECGTMLFLVLTLGIRAGFWTLRSTLLSLQKQFFLR